MADKSQPKKGANEKMDGKNMINFLLNLFIANFSPV